MRIFTVLSSTFLLLLFMVMATTVDAQDIYVRVWADGAMDGGDCSDCLGTTDGVDPRVSVRFKIGNSGTGGGSWGATYLTGVGDQGCDNWDDFNNNNPITSGLGNATYAEYIHVQMTGYESDGFTCSADDGNCGGINWPTYNYSAGGGNHKQINGYAGGTCANGDYQSNRNGCSSDNSTNDYKIRYCYDFYFTNASTIATPTITATNTTECIGWDPPTIYGCCVTPSWRDRQWQQSINGGAWSNISGATGLDYNPPALGAAGTYAYRVYYRYAAAFSTSSSFHYKYSNVVTHTVAACPEQDFGNCVWNVNAYQGTDINTLTNNTFKGYYVEPLETYDSRNRWPTAGSPQDASGYVGLPIGSDNMVVVSKRRSCNCGYYNLAVRHDDAYRLQIDGNIVASGGCCADPTGTVWTGNIFNNSTIEMRHQEGVGNTYQGVIFNKIDYPDPGFGNAVWNSAVYNGNNINLGITREGYYVEPLLTYNSVDRWCSNCAPSDASGYVGCPVGVDNHTVVSKRQNFDCKYYQIDITMHDDATRLYVNGAQVFDEAACCHEHINVWSGVLGASSNIEFRHAEGGGGSTQGLRFTEIAEPVASNNLTEICSNSPAPVTYTLSGASLGGNIPYNFVRWQYQWDGTAGTWTNWGTTNPYVWAPGTGNSGRTLYVRAEFTGAGCTKYSNITSVYLSPQPEGSVAASATQVCSGTQVDFTTTMLLGNFVRYQYQWNGTGGAWTNWGATNPYSWISGNPGNTLFVRAEMVNSVCTSFYTAAVAVQVDVPPSVGTLNDPGPVEFCDNLGNVPQISVSGSSGTLWWDWGEPNGTWHTFWINGPNAGTCCFPVNTGAANAGADRFRVRASNGVCPEVTSTVVLLENQNTPNPTSLTSSLTDGCAGYSGNITLTASFPYGTNTTANVISDYSSVQFYSGGCPGTLLGTVAHTNGVANLVVSAPGITTTYYARGTSDCETSTCANVTYTVHPDATISSSGGGTVCTGGALTLSSSTSGGFGTCTYQWQISTTGAGGSYSNIGGATASTYNTGALTATRWYRVQRICSGNGCDDPYSNVQTVTVVADPTISVSGATTICSGGTAALSSSTSGGTGTCTYQWQVSTISSSSGFGNIGGANASTYNTPALTVTSWYRVIRNCDGSDCSDPTSNAVEVTVVPDPVVSSSGGGTICSGGNLTLSSSTSGGSGTCTYQWQISTAGSGGPFTNIGGAVNSTYNTGALAATTWYRVQRICSGTGCDAPYSNVQTVTVENPSSVGTYNDAGPIETCDHVGNIPQISVSGYTGSLQWQWGGPDGSWNNWVTGPDAGLCCFGVNPTGASADRIRVIATNGTCPAVTGATILIENQNSPAPSSLTSSITQTCSGYTGNIDLTATFPFALNTTTDVISNYSQVQFYSGSCGGTLLGTVPHTNGTAVLTISAPATTTTYYARSTSSCETSGCASATFTVIPDQTPPTLNTATPGNGSTICLGESVSATFNAGFDGISCTDLYEFSDDGGGSWSSYTPGNPIVSTQGGSGAVQVRASRNCTGLECDNDGWVVIASWNVTDPGAPLGFGNSIWNVNAYQGQDYNLGGGISFYGYYTESSLSYDSRSRWTNGENGTPSTASGYVGCDVTIDDHTVVYKRQNFPCGIYTLDNTFHDDEIMVLVDGVSRLDHFACCDQHFGFWTGYLGTGSTIEVRHADGTFGSGQALVVNNVTPAMNGGNISADQTICTGGDPANLTNNAAASGGVSAYFGSISYQWQSSPDNTNWTNIGGATASTYDPPIPGATIYYQRIATDACGSSAASNVVTITVVADPSISAAGATSLCIWSGTTLTSSTSGGTGNCTYQWQISTTGSGGPFSNVGGNTSTYDTGLLTATSWFRVIRSCDGLACDNATSNVVEVTIDNTAPTAVCQDLTVELDGNGEAYIMAYSPSSVDDWSDEQNVCNWQYGQYFANSTLSFDSLPVWNGNAWHDFQSFGTPFIDQYGGHPGVDDFKWAVRRWVSTYTGDITISGVLFDRDLGCGNGAHVRIFHNTTEVWQYYDIPGTSTPYSINLTVAIGDKVDFIIDPKNTDTGCDNTEFTANITTNPAGNVVNDGSSDNCDISCITLDISAFDCTDIGSNIVTLTVTDNNGNAANCNATITVQDNGVASTAPTSVTGPTGICAGDAVTLTANGGSLGLNALYEWDDNPGFTSPVTTALNTYTTPVINANTTWYVRIKGVCQNTAAVSHTVTITAPSSMAYLIQNGDPNGFDGSTLNRICEEGPWSFYTVAGIVDKYVFAINWDPLSVGGGHNALAKAAAIPRIDVDNTYTSAISTPVSDCFATFAMSRYWNVDIGANNLEGPVMVRFYYDIQEANDIITARNNHNSTFGCSAEGGFEWFKTQTTVYDPAVAVTPINITDGTFIYNFNTGGLTNNNVLYAELLVNSFSGGSGATGSGNQNNPLPVELVTFSATAFTNSIRLDWTTLSEINNERFDILKSLDGVNFMKIDEVPGNGSSTDPIDYSYDDHDVEPGILYYYRLNQIDFDGTNEYSPVVSAMIDPLGQQLFVGELIPNPTVNVSYIDLTLPEHSSIDVTVLNMLGQVMYSVGGIDLQAGNQRLEINASGLSKGNYLVSIQINDGYNYLRKMIVID